LKGLRKILNDKVKRYASQPIRVELSNKQTKSVYTIDIRKKIIRFNRGWAEQNKSNFTILDAIVFDAYTEVSKI